MSLAEELAENWGNTGCHMSGPSVVRAAVLGAINEAIERCAQEVEVPLCGSRDCKCKIFAEQNAKRIRALKSSTSQNTSQSESAQKV